MSLLWRDHALPPHLDDMANPALRAALHQVRLYRSHAHKIRLNRWEAHRFRCSGRTERATMGGVRTKGPLAMLEALFLRPGR